MKGEFKRFTVPAGGIVGSAAYLIGGVGIVGGFGAIGVPALAVGAVGVSVGSLFGLLAGELAEHFVEENEA